MERPDKKVIKKEIIPTLMNNANKPSRKIWIAVLLILMMIGTIIWLWENKNLFHKPRVRSIDEPEIIQAISANQTKLLVLGVDGATWSIITGLIGRDKLPNFRRLLAQGSRGIMHSEEPMISPALWTTFATGVSRSKHRIDNFVFKPVRSYAIEKMDSRVREAPALWEILSHYGKKVAVVNWNSASPAEPVRGVFIAEGASPDNLNPENVYPTDWIEKLKNLPTLKVDWFETELAKWAHPMPKKGYEEDLFIVSAGIEILKQESPDLMMIYFRNIDMVSHLFWKYRWPVGIEYQFQVSEQEQERWGEVIERYYQLMDELIGKLLEASPGYTVMLFSDHGQSATYAPKNIFVELNLLLHQLGFLEYNLSRCEDILIRMRERSLYLSEEPARDIFFDCEFLRQKQFADVQILARFLVTNKKIPEQNLDASWDLLHQLFISLSNPESAREINWRKTQLFNVEDFHKTIRGIYINLKNREPEGVVELKNYTRFRKEVMRQLRLLQNEKGEKFFKMVQANPKKKKPISSGIIDEPDILVEFNPAVLAGQYLYRHKRDSSPFFISSVLWSYQDVSGDHSPEGVIIIAGKDALPGRQISSSIYDITPTVLWLFDAGLARDFPGKPLSFAFNLEKKSIRYVSSYMGAIKIPVEYWPKAMTEEEKQKLKAVGYIK